MSVWSLGNADIFGSCSLQIKLSQFVKAKFDKYGDGYSKPVKAGFVPT